MTARIMFLGQSSESVAAEPRLTGRTWQPCRPLITAGGCDLRSRSLGVGRPSRNVASRRAMQLMLALRGPTWGRDAMNDLPDGLTRRPAPADLERWLTGPRFRRAAGARGDAPAAAAVVRVLSAEDRGAGAATLDLHPPAGAAAAALRLRHLRGRRQHAAAHPRHGGAHRAGDRPGAGGTSDLRGRDPRRRWTRWRGSIGMPACVTSSRCAAIRPPGASYRAAPRRLSRSRSTWWPD